MDFWWKLVLVSIFLLVAIAVVPIPKTERIKAKKFDLGLLLAAFSYFGLLIVLPLVYFLFHRSNRFLIFHLRQGVIIFALLLLSVFVAKYVELLGIIMFISLGTVAIFAMIQASRGYFWHLPLIGKLVN